MKSPTINGLMLTNVFNSNSRLCLKLDVAAFSANMYRTVISSWLIILLIRRNSLYFFLVNFSLKSIPSGVRIATPVSFLVLPG